jgi:high-affinity nickel-transport protein
MALPLAFTAAMTLCDSANGVTMMKMYKSAITNPHRKLGFNAAITGISAISALFISVITLTGFLNAAFELEDPVSAWLAGINLGDAGLILVGLLAVVWALSTLRSRTAAPITTAKKSGTLRAS